MMRGFGLVLATIVGCGLGLGDAVAKPSEFYEPGLKPPARVGSSSSAGKSSAARKRVASKTVAREEPGFFERLSTSLSSSGEATGEAPGTIIVDTQAKRLHLALADGNTKTYAIGVGRAGFTWKGSAKIARKAEWPAWTPPDAMRDRQPNLPTHMVGGPNNPLGARALYLYSPSGDTGYRIHGTTEEWSIGREVSSGCIRLLNKDVMDLYERVDIGAKVIVR